MVLFTAQLPSAQAQLEEVIVTARRVAENMQDTPISITALSGYALESRQIFSTELLDEVTPNLQFTNQTTLAGNNSTSAVFIRGVGQTDPTSTVDPGVALYLDDVYRGQSVGGSMALRDIERIEVLRGPQGTLFGRNTIGGAIVITTKPPGDELAASAELSLGSDNRRDIFLAMDFPITNTLLSRFALGSRDWDGYVTRIQTGEDLGDANDWSVTAKFIWAPSARLQAKLLFDYTKADENGNPFVFAASNESAAFQWAASIDAGCPGAVSGNVPLLNDDRCANDFQNRGPFANNGTFPLESYLENFGSSLHFEYGYNDAWSFKSITAYRAADWSGVRDADNTPLPILHTAYIVDSWQFTQELQARYTGDHLSGVIGAYYFSEESDDRVTISLFPPPRIGFGSPQVDRDDNLTQNRSVALFSQWNYDFSDQLSLTAGIRHTKDTKASTPDQFNPVMPDIKWLPVRKYEDTFTDTSITLNASYRFSESLMTYITYAEGFKGGGWNSHFNGPQTQEQLDLFHQFEQEEATNKELGVKMDLLDSSLRMNAAIFSTRYTDLQFTYRVDVAPYLANAGEASIEGLEIEASWMPRENLRIDAAYGYLDATIDSLQDVPPGAAIGVKVGNVLPFAPKATYSLGVSYGMALGVFSVTPRADLFKQDTTYFDANNTAEIAQLDPFTKLNLSVQVSQSGSPWKLVAGVNNATNKIYAVGGNSSLTTGSGYAEVGYARGRWYFLNASYAF